MVTYLPIRTCPYWAGLLRFAIMNLEMRNYVEEIDARLLDAVQRDFPVHPTPFEELGKQLGLSAAEVVDRIERLKARGVIRQISAIFDSTALGYRSVLAAFEVEDASLDKVAHVVASHSGVSHCYARDARYNLWFTITVPPEGEVEQEVSEAAKQHGVRDYLILPAIKVFKIGVFLSMSEETRAADLKPQTHIPKSQIPIEQINRSAVKALQRDLPLTERPFKILAETEGLTEEDLLVHARHMLDTGVMRRFAAVLRHVRAGYRANAMVCWDVLPEAREKVGLSMADHPAVSHCYERPSYPQWPYSIYTMIHSRTKPALFDIIDELARLSGISAYKVLQSIREYKKSRVSYFLE